MSSAGPPIVSVGTQAKLSHQLFQEASYSVGLTQILDRLVQISSVHYSTKITLTTHSVTQSVVKLRCFLCGYLYFHAPLSVRLVISQTPR